MGGLGREEEVAGAHDHALAHGQRRDRLLLLPGAEDFDRAGVARLEVEVRGPRRLPHGGLEVLQPLHEALVVLPQALGPVLLRLRLLLLLLRLLLRL